MSATLPALMAGRGAVGGRITKLPGDVAGWELVQRSVPTGTKCRQDNEMKKKGIQGPFWSWRAVCGGSSRFTKETASAGAAPSRQASPHRV